GSSDVFNCGYGSGYSVLDVIAAVKEISGVDFEVRMTDRRPGDPEALIAQADKIRDALGWKPQLDDLKTIVRHALTWESQLERYRLAS
ncbi:MAG: UDP-glucose 4-epimerase GalE, partial [Hyphomicrobiaceae bacterium]